MGGAASDDERRVTGAGTGPHDAVRLHIPPPPLASATAERATTWDTVVV